MERGEIRIGVCSWADKQLLSSGWYPKSVKSPSDRLAHYSSHFNTVEIDSTFYALPRLENVYLWSASVPKGFLFSVKAYGLFTFHGVNPSTLPAEVRQSLNRDIVSSHKIYHSQIPLELRRLVLDKFKQMLKVLIDTNKLGYILFQFPPWFRPSDKAFQFLARIRKEFQQARLAVEVRHNSWLASEPKKKLISILTDDNIAFVAVDEPPLLWTLPREYNPTALWGGVFRFHGRNVETWSKKGASVSERFHYIYSDGEMRQWIPSIQSAASSQGTVFVMFNNCWGDYAARNAEKMKEMLSSENDQ